MELYKRTWMLHKGHDLATRIVIMAVCLFGANPIQALEFAFPDKGIVELNTHIQLNALDGDDCDIDFCDEYELGARRVDFDLKYRYFLYQNVQLYFGFDFDLSEREDNDLTESTPRFGIEGTERNSAEDDTIEQAYLGAVFKKFGLELGVLDSATSAFGVANTNFLGYSLNAFNDDRVPEYDLFKLESARVSYLHHKFNLLVGVADGDDKDQDFDVDYEVLANFVVPRFSWIKVQIASRRVVDNVTNVESDSYGIRFNPFSKRGFNFGIGYSENELGKYAELGAKWIFKHQNQFEIGLGQFESDLSGKVSTIRRDIEDLDFWYANYARTISKSARAFVEFDRLKGTDQRSDSGETLDSLMVGIEFTF